MSEPGPYEKTTFDGKTVDEKTKDALQWADKRFREKYPGKRLELAQGSYNAGGVKASAGTHDGGGVIDARTSGVGLNSEQTKFLLKCLKKAGFAAWIRDHRDGMDPHIHACLLAAEGKYHKTMAQGARNQCDSYLAGRNGLRNNAKDRNPWRPDPQVYWNYGKHKPVER